MVENDSSREESGAGSRREGGRVRGESVFGESATKEGGGIRPRRQVRFRVKRNVDQGDIPHPPTCSGR